MWWLWLVPAQAQAEQIDQALLEAVARAVTAIIGMGGGGSIVLLTIAYITKQWLAGRRRGSGGDEEYEAKQQTRLQIKEQSDMLVRIASSLEHAAEIYERMSRDMSSMRRESYESFADIKAVLKR